MLADEAFGDDFEMEEFETEELNKKVNMRDYILKMPQTFRDGYAYMKKMDEMMRYEFHDVDDEELFTFKLNDFHTDNDQKKSPFEERDAWIATVTTHFKFADDKDCRGRKHKVGQEGRRGMIASCLRDYFNLEVGNQKSKCINLSSYAVSSYLQMHKFKL